MAPTGSSKKIRPRARAARMSVSTSGSSTSSNGSSTDIASATGLSRRPRRERKKAVLVGVAVSEEDGADASGALRAHLDVEKIREVLLNHCGYRDEDIVVMLDRKDSPKHLRPTKRNLERRLERLTRKAEAGDKFFFFYAGHGEQRPCHSDSESDGLDEFISCENGRTIKDNRLRRLLVDPLPAGAQLFALFDTCHAGTMLDLPHAARARVFSVSLAFIVVGRLQRVVAGVRVRAAAAATAASGLPSKMSREVEVDVEVEVIQSRMATLNVEMDVLSAPRRTARKRRRPSSTSTTGTSPPSSPLTTPSSSPQPRVLALSSTADDEESWESSEGGPLASAFASVLSESAASGLLTPRTLLKEVQRVLAVSCAERAAKVDAWHQQYMLELASRGTGLAIGGVGEDEMMDLVERAKKVQRPQLSSLQPLDIDMPLFV